MASSFNDRMKLGLEERGFPPGQINDEWYKLLGSLGFTGSLNDRINADLKGRGYRGILDWQVADLVDELLPPMGTVSWNADDKDANVILSNNDLTATRSTGTSHAYVRADPPSGDGTVAWYCEYTFVLNSSVLDGYFGVSNLSDVLIGMYVGQTANTAGYSEDGGIYKDDTPGFVLPALDTGDVIMVAHDPLDLQKIYFGKNGVWGNSADPAAGTGAVAGIIGTVAAPAVSLRETNDQVTANFGDSPFIYTPPVGYVGYKDV